MRKLIVTNIASLDGFIAGTEGNVLALPMDHRFDEHNRDRLLAADVLVLGRRSFEMFQGFWPTVAENPQASAVNREISRLNGAIRKVVVSNTLQAKQTGAWGSTTTVVRRETAHAEIEKLKQSGDKDMLVFGSRTLWNALLQARLVDELHLMVGATVLGDGVRAFDGGTEAQLDLLDVQRWNDSGNVLMKYSVRK